MFSLLLLFLIHISLFSQSRWFSSSDLSLVFPNQMRYLFTDDANRSVFVDLPVGTGSMLKSFSAEYSYNYLLLNKVSIGVTGGFQTYTRFDYQFIKLGGIIRYYFVDTENVFTYVQYARDISINRSTSNGGHDFKLGLEFPVLRRERFNINAKIYNQTDILNIEHTSPILNYVDEEPIQMKIKSLGIGVGVRFK